jgi:hypothetical protein
MRNYYASDKKRREDAKRKKAEAKRQKRRNKGSAPDAGNPEPEEKEPAANPEVESHE